jgi:hypothetical protein
MGLVVAPNVFQITPRRRPRTENAAPLLLRAILLVFPRDRYLARPLARLLLPSNIKHSSYCCIRIFRAWPRDGRASVVVCTSIVGFSPSRCLAIL